MKNKNLEVEALPLNLTINRGANFSLREIEKGYQVKKDEARSKIIFYKILLNSIILGLFFFFPLLSSGESFEHEILSLVNQERSANHVAGLVYNDTLAQAAYHKAKDMIEKNYFSHTSPDGIKAWDFILAEKYDYHYAGENLAMNFSSSKKAFEAWLNSPEHLKNIMDKDYQETGIAVIEGTINNKNTILIVELFGSR